MNRLRLAIVFPVLLLAHQAAAVTIVECEDPEGNRTFQSYCPPGSTEVTQKRISTAIPRPIQPNITPVLYLAPDCRACDAVRSFFQNQEIGIVIKNIDKNDDLQKELQELVGDLHIPTVAINGRVLKDYKRDQLVQTLEDLGFTIDPEKF